MVGKQIDICSYNITTPFRVLIYSKSVRISPQYATAACIVTMWKLAILLTILFNKVFADRHVTCYYRNWAQHGKAKAKFLPENIDPSLCSVIKYAFMRVNHKTNELETTQDNDGEMLARINALKMVKPSLQVVIAVGKW